MSNETIPIEPEPIKEYLDESIQYWRNEENNPHSTGAIHALQSVRSSLFGEMNPCPVCGETQPHGHTVEE